MGAIMQQKKTWQDRGKKIFDFDQTRISLYDDLVISLGETYALPGLCGGCSVAWLIWLKQEHLAKKEKAEDFVKSAYGERSNYAMTISQNANPIGNGKDKWYTVAVDRVTSATGFKLAGDLPYHDNALNNALKDTVYRTYGSFLVAWAEGSWASHAVVFYITDEGNVLFFEPNYGMYFFEYKDFFGDTGALNAYLTEVYGPTHHVYAYLIQKK